MYWSLRTRPTSPRSTVIAATCRTPTRPQPDLLCGVAFEITQRVHVFTIGEQDYELRRINGGRAPRHASGPKNWLIE